MDCGKVSPDVTSFDSIPVADSADRPVFSAVIRPHRSLGQAGIRLVLTLFCVAAVVSSLPFLIMGAWPVAGFFGLDILALVIAFRLNQRSARGREEVCLTPVELLLARITDRGHRTERRLNPLWTRLDREHDDEFGLLAIALVSRGERIVFARDLSPSEREDFAQEFGAALARVKRGY